MCFTKLWPWHQMAQKWMRCCWIIAAVTLWECADILIWDLQLFSVKLPKKSCQTLKLWFLSSKQERKKIFHISKEKIKKCQKILKHVHDFHSFFFVQSGHRFFSHHRVKCSMEKTLTVIDNMISLPGLGMYQTLALSVNSFYVLTGCTIHSTNHHFWVFLAQQVQQTGGVRV